MKVFNLNIDVKKISVSVVFITTAIFYFIRAVQKTMLFITVSLLLIFITQAQTSHSRWKENFDIQEFRTRTIDIPAPEEKISLANIGNISVIDARADTGRVGFLQKKIVDPFSGALNNAASNQEEQKINTRPTFIKLTGGVRNQTEQFARSYLSFSGNTPAPSVLMIIKKLWLSDELNFDGQRSNGQPLYSNKDVWTSGIDVVIEFYLNDATDYYPLYKYDSIISKALTVSEYGPQFIQLAFQKAMEKMKQMDLKIAAIKTRRKFSFEEIKQHNEDAFNFPALKNDSLKRGVYMTFDEFKKNNPSAVDYELKKDKLTDVVYIKQAAGSEYLARDAWGYCDGINAYIKSAENFFLLQRHENAFYVYGAKRLMVDDNSGGAAPMTYYPGTAPGGAGGYWAPGAGSFSGSKRSIRLQPFQLDWNTGKLY